MQENFLELWHTGSVREVGTLKDGKKDGQFKVFFDSTCMKQQIWGIKIYLNGEKIGIWKTFHPNGQLQWQWEYENGLRKDGIYPEYNYKGKLIGYNQILNHKLYKGTVLLYWPDGTIREFYKVKNYIKI